MFSLCRVSKYFYGIFGREFLPDVKILRAADREFEGQLPVSNSGTVPLKVVLVNGYGAGKTSAIRVYNAHKFQDYQPPTVGFEWYATDLLLRSHSVHLLVWDTSGSLRFLSQTMFSCMKLHACIIMYSIGDRREGFDTISTWSRTVRSINPLVRLIVCGNKADLSKRGVTREEGQHIAQSIGADVWIETSAKTGHNIDKLFFLAALHALQSAHDSLLIPQNNNPAPTPINSSSLTAREPSSCSLL